jgi:hypothetical protein
VLARSSANDSAARRFLLPEHAFRQFRADVATPSEPARQAAREYLDAMIQRPRRKSRWWPRRVVLLALAVAAMIGVIVAWPSSRVASNRVVERAAAALRPEPDRTYATSVTLRTSSR